MPSSLFIKTTEFSDLMAKARYLQGERVPILNEAAERHPEGLPKPIARLLHRAADCKGLTFHSGFWCEVTQLCLPCAVIAEVKVAKVRQEAYRKIGRLGYDRCLLVTVTARRLDGDDLYQNQHKSAVKAQTEAILASLKKRRVTIATDVAPEIGVSGDGPNYHHHLVVWIDPASELSDDEIRDIALKARHHAVDRLQPRPDGQAWFEVPSSDWLKPAPYPEGLPRYFSEAIHALDNGTGGLHTLSPLDQFNSATLMAGEHSMRLAGLLRLVSTEGYDASRLVMVTMNVDYFAQPTESRMPAEHPIVRPLFEGVEESHYKVGLFSANNLKVLYLEGLMAAMKPRPARELSRRVSRRLWPRHKSPLDQLRQLREECIRAGLVRDGCLTDKGAVAIGLTLDHELLNVA